MADYLENTSPKPRLFSVVPDSSEPPQKPPSEPSVLALLVADALQQAKLGRAVLEMRASPAGWISFLTELDGVLRQDCRGD